MSNFFMITWLRNANQYLTRTNRPCRKNPKGLRRGVAALKKGVWRSGAPLTYFFLGIYIFPLFFCIKKICRTHFSINQKRTKFFNFRSPSLFFSEVGFFSNPFFPFWTFSEPFWSLLKSWSCISLSGKIRFFLKNY